MSLTLIVEHDRQHGDIVSRRNPIHRSRRAEQIRAIAHHMADKLPLVRSSVLEIRCQLNTQGTASRPPQAAATTIDPRARRRRLNLVRHEHRICHSLDSPDGVSRNGFLDHHRDNADLCEKDP